MCLLTIARRFDASLLAPIRCDVSNRLTALTGHRKRLVRRAAADAKNAWWILFIHRQIVTDHFLFRCMIWSKSRLLCVIYLYLKMDFIKWFNNWNYKRWNRTFLSPIHCRFRSYIVKIPDNRYWQQCQLLVFLFITNWSWLLFHINEVDMSIVDGAYQLIVVEMNNRSQPSSAITNIHLWSIDLIGFLKSRRRQSIHSNCYRFIGGEQQSKLYWLYTCIWTSVRRIDNWSILHLK
jgi:hypothetical protein